MHNVNNYITNNHEIVECPSPRVATLQVQTKCTCYLGRALHLWQWMKQDLLAYGSLAYLHGSVSQSVRYN